jgi:hypothetical protein
LVLLYIEKFGNPGLGREGEKTAVSRNVAPSVALRKKIDKINSFVVLQRRKYKISELRMRASTEAQIRVARFFLVQYTNAGEKYTK